MVSPVARAAEVDLEVVGQLRLVFVRLARRIRQRADEGITPSQLAALSTIARHGPMRLGDLAVREHIGKSSVTRLAASLEAAGYVARVVDPADGRGSLVATTEDGREVLAVSERRVEAYLARQVAGLDAADREVLAACLPVLERLLAVRA